MSEQSRRRRLAEFLGNGSSKRLLIPILRNLMMGASSLAWLSPYLASRAFPEQLQPQQSAVIPAPEEEELGNSAELLLPGSLSGTVTDATGAVLVGARVTLTRPGPFAPEEAVSGEYGQFSFRNVLPGTFQITTTASGFATHRFSGILHSGQSYIVSPSRLAPGTLHTEVEVTVPQTEVAAAQVKAQEKQRMIGVIPNFYVTYIPDAAPMTSKQKFGLAWRTLIDPVTFALAGASAGVQQANNGYSGFGQGAEGYAKRFGASYADNATGTLIGDAILPSLLKQDPRYFYKGTGSTGSRLLYAIAHSVRCKGNNGHWQFNYSAILGGLASGAISNAYYPDKDRGTALIFENALIGTGETAVVNVFQEFIVRQFTTHVPKRDPSKP